MDKVELLNIVNAHLDEAESEFYTQIESDREKAFEYYLQQPYGNELEGRSAVVTSEVADAIHWMLPSLMKTFTSSENIAAFDPRGPMDEEAARQETDYINHVFYKECDGFKILYDWFFDALLLKNGVIKVGWDSNEQVTHETYSKLTNDEFTMLAGEREMEIDNYDVDEDGMIDAEFTRTCNKGKAFVEVVPPEEFYIDPNYEHLSLDESPFICHETRISKSDLIQSGFDKELVEEMNNHYTVNGEAVSDARNADIGTTSFDTQDSQDESVNEILVSECYVRVDYDGDGIAELRHIVIFNRTEIALNEEADTIPFVSITPVPVAHRFYGRSIADQTMDLQLQKSTLLRNILDNLYLTNNQEKIVLDGGANLEDLLTSRPGGVKREYVPNAIRPMPVTPFTGHPYQMLEYFDEMKENRTGVTKYNQGMDAESLNQTATGVNKIMTASQSRMDLIARLFADGIRQLMIKLHGVLLKNQNKEKVVKLRGTYVQVDPSEWRERTQMTVNVGLGTSDSQQQLSSLQMVLGLQMQAMGAGMTTPALIYNTFTKIVEAAGLKTPELYFTPPQQMPMQGQQQQQPDPQSQALMMNAQAQMERNQVQREKNWMDHETNRMELQIKAQDSAIKEAEAQTKRMNVTGNLTMDSKRFDAEIDRDVEAIFEAVEQENLERAKLNQVNQQMRTNNESTNNNSGPSGS